MVEFRLLGPVEVWAAGRPLDVGQPRQRAVLAALASDAGRTVSSETLIDRVWGDAPPQGARRSLHAHIARIRRVLEQGSMPDEQPVPLVHRAGGYLLDSDRERVDLHRMRDLLERSRRTDTAAEQRVELLRQATALWRGHPLAGVPGQWAVRMRDSWTQLHSDVLLTWARAELAINNPDAVIGRLRELAGENALSESLTAVLMRALQAAGRPAEALEQYTTIRQRLVEELGVDPSAELQTLHEQILRSDPGPPSMSPVPAGHQRHVPPAPDHARRRPTRRAVTLPVAASVFVAGLGIGVVGTRWWHNQQQPSTVAAAVVPGPPDVCLAPGATSPTGQDVLGLPEVTGKAAGSWWVNRSANAALNTDGRQFTVDVTQGTQRPGDVLVVKSDVTLARGRTYALAFTALADRATTIRVRAQDSQPPAYVPSYDRELSVNRQACRHLYRFVAVKTSDHSELTFQVGGHDEDFQLKVADITLVAQSPPG